MLNTGANMGLKKIAYDIVKKNETLRKAARSLSAKKQIGQYEKIAKNTVVNNNKVYFVSFDGRSYGDSPKAIYEKMLTMNEFEDFEYVWAFNQPEEYKWLEKNINTKVVKRNTSDEDIEVAQSKYWITNFKLVDKFIPKKEQIYVQCWHGTPLKKLGYDLEKSDNVMNSIDEIRDKYKTDAHRFTYLLSPSKFTTEKFATAWNLKEFGREDALLEEGYPRNDFLSNATAEDIEEIKVKLGMDQIGDKKIILYAPTWRDNQHQSGVGYTYKTEVDFDKLRDELGDEYVILFRAHYLVANSFDFDKYQGFVYDVSKYDDINHLYLAADVLITDYSSVFFDYAILEKPMIFYMYDLEDYRDNLRGFYIGLDELPGEIAENELTLIEALKVIDNQYDFNKLREFNKIYNNLSDGNAAERVIKRVFGLLYR